MTNVEGSKQEAHAVNKMKYKTVDFDNSHDAQFDSRHSQGNRNHQAGSMQNRTRDLAEARDFSCTHYKKQPMPSAANANMQTRILASLNP